MSKAAFNESVSNTGSAYTTSKAFRQRFQGAYAASRRLSRTQEGIKGARARRIWLRVKAGTITGRSLEGVLRDNARWFDQFREEDKFTAKLKPQKNKDSQ